MWYEYLRKERVIAQNPIFIVGFPRSGTTLLQSLLVTQPGMVSFPETHFFLSVLPCLKTAGGSNVITEIAGEVFSLMQEKTGIKFSLPEQQEIRNQVKQKQLSSKDFLELMVLKSLDLENRPPGNANFRWIEKTPYHAAFINQIFAFYPEVKIVYMLRHPVAAISSTRKNLSASCPLSVSEMAKSWKEIHTIAWNFFKQHRKRLCFLKYEELTENLSEEFCRLADFIEFEADISLLKNFRKQVDRLVHPWEVWKKDNLCKKVEQMNYKHFDMPGDDVAAIENILVREMKKWKYSSFLNY